MDKKTRTKTREQGTKRARQARSKRPTDPLTTLAALLALPLSQRITAIAKDVRSRADRFRVINAFDLARALGVSQPEMPDNEWSFTTYAERQTIEEYIDRGGEEWAVLQWLEGAVDEQRFRSLEKMFAKLEGAANSSFDFLSAIERKHVEDAISEEQLESNQSNGMCCIASHCVRLGKVQLWFEAVVEDDGSCIDLKTPYDDRDGLCQGLSNCVTSSW